MRKILIRRIGLLFSSIAFLSSIFNLIMSFIDLGNFKGNEYNFIILSFAILMYITSHYRIGAYFQVSCLVLTAVITFMDNPETGYGVAQIVLVVLLSEKYGFFKKRVILKVSISTAIFLAVFLTSILLNDHKAYIIFPTILFLVLFAASYVLIKYEDIKSYIENEKRLKREIKELGETLQETKERLDKVDTSYIDPVEAGLSRAELVLLKSLCLYKESNVDLAKRLSKSRNTVKVQMTNIMIKIGAESRHQLVDLCKNYYIQEDKDL